MIIIKILKGTNEIGGSCVELKTKNTTIVVDYGTPLNEDNKQVKIQDNIDAILISHPHQDHYGEIVNVNTNIPIYCGKLSLELMNTTKIFANQEKLKNNFKQFEAWSSFSIGDFTITPYLVDHSAVDAYAFLIEAKGKRVFYSGDFRANGRKSKLFYDLMQKEELKNLDLMLMEGTMIERSNEKFVNEQSIEEKIYKTINNNDLISFLISSSQNIDRIVSAYRACKKAKKIFVVDIYTAWIFETIKLVSKHAPNIDWEEIKVYKPTTKTGGAQYSKLRENQDFFKNFKYKVFNKNNIIKFEDIKKEPSKYVVKCSPWYIEEILSILDLKDANIIYSQWLGHKDKKYSNEKTEYLYQKLDKYNMIYAHTSGHADLDTLKKFATSMKAKTIIPIHTEHKEKFKEYFDRVVILDDDEEYKIEGDYMQLNRIEGVKSLLENLKNEELYTLLSKDRDVFMAFRKNSIDFYNNSKLFSYTKDGFISHKKFCFNADARQDYINIKDLDKIKPITDIVKNYKLIKENAKNYSGEEAQGVSKLYKYSYKNMHDDIFLIDIEIALYSSDAKDRIDILLYDIKKEELKFVEAKHFSNKELWSQERKKPVVIEQIRRYEKTINENSTIILNEYQKYVEILNNNFGLDLPLPKTIHPKVKLLMFGFDQSQMEKIKKLLKDDGSLEGIEYYFIGNINSIKLKTLYGK